jgi:hypothetical protein
LRWLAEQPHEGAADPFWIGNADLSRHDLDRLAAALAYAASRPPHAATRRTDRIRELPREVQAERSEAASKPGDN